MPDDLNVVIYLGNNKFAIVHISLNKNRGELGYDYAGSISALEGTAITIGEASPIRDK